MKLLLCFSLLSIIPLTAAQTTTKKSTIKNQKPKQSLTSSQTPLTASNAQQAETQATKDAKQAEVLAQKAQEAKLQAQEEAKKAQELKTLNQQAESLGIEPEIDVINLSGQPLTLVGIMQNGTSTSIGSFEQDEIPAQTITIPSGVISIAVQGNNQKSNIFPLINGLQAVTITLESNIGSNTFEIKPLVPEEGNNLLIYNALSTAHTIKISYHKKSSNVIIEYLKNITGNSVQFSYHVAAQQACTITIPDTINGTPISHIKITGIDSLIDTTGHNSFVIHEQDKKIIYTSIVPDKV